MELRSVGADGPWTKGKPQSC